MKNKIKDIEINLDDPSAKGKIFSFETFKFYDSKTKQKQDIRKMKIRKLINLMKIDINLEENKIDLISKIDFKNLIVSIFIWNPYDDSETELYTTSGPISKNVSYWYAPTLQMREKYGIIVRILESQEIIKEEKFRLKTKYGNIIKKQAVVTYPNSGFGDNLFCTPTIKKLYEIYNRKITLYTYFPDIFINNPYIENTIKIDDINNLNIDVNEYEVHNLGHIHTKPFDIIDKNNPDRISLYSHQIGLNLDEKRIEFFPDDCEIPKLPEIYIVINTNQTHGPRTWGTDNYNKLIKILEDEKIFVVALGKDCDYVDNNQVGSKESLKNIEISYGLNLVNKTTLSQAWYIINNSAGFVSHTSGLFHLAMSTNADIYELCCNCAFSDWMTRDKKTIHVEGKCTLHCYDNNWCCVSEHGTINKYMPTYQCHMGYEKYECHPTPEQVFEEVIKKLPKKLKIEKVNSIFDVDECNFLKENDIVIDYKSFREAIHSKNCYEWYYSISKSIKPKSILEIGVRYGFSLCSMALGCDKDVYLEGWDNLNPEYVGDKKVLDYAVNNIESIDYKVNLKIIDSHIVEKLDRNFDLIHIDGDHSYEGALSDINLVKHNTKYMLINDYSFISDVKKAVDYFVENNQDIIEYTEFFDSYRGTFLIKFK